MGGLISSKFDEEDDIEVFKNLKLEIVVLLIV